MTFIKTSLTIISFIDKLKIALGFQSSVTSERAQVEFKENKLLLDENGQKYIVFYVTFKLHDDSIKKHQVSFWQYQNLRLGTKGILRFQGISYKGFNKTK